MEYEAIKLVNERISKNRVLGIRINRHIDVYH
jgi:hypothetical protein